MQKVLQQETKAYYKPPFIGLLRQGINDERFKAEVEDELVKEGGKAK